MFKKPEIYKVIYFNQFMLWVSYLIFIDSFLIILDDKNIFNINFRYIRDHLAYIPILIVVYIFSMSVMSSVLQQCIKILKYFKDIVLIKYFNKVHELKDLTNYIPTYKVKNIAIVQNNSVLYNEYKMHINIVNKTLTEKKIASGLVFYV